MDPRQAQKGGEKENPIYVRFREEIDKEEKEIDERRDENGQPLPKSQVKKLKKEIFTKYRKLFNAEKLKEKEKANIAEEERTMEEIKRIILVEDKSLPKARGMKINELRKSFEDPESDFAKHPPRVELWGWCHRVRWEGKNLFFVSLRDGTGFIQCVFHSSGSLPTFGPEEKIPERIESSSLITYCSDALKLCRECSIMIRGTPRLYKNDKCSDIEIGVDYWKLEGEGNTNIEELFTPDSGLDVLLKWRHLMLRGQTASAIQKIRGSILDEFKLHFMSCGCREVSPPTIVGTFCESGSNLFSLKYYDTTAYLTQSSQLYLEAAISSVGDCYCVLPSFRAEKSRTRRHLAEFTHLETEHPFINFENDPVNGEKGGLLNKIENMICSVVGGVISKHYDDLIDSFGKPIENVHNEHGKNEYIATNGEDHVRKICDMIGFDLEELLASKPSLLSTSVPKHTPFVRMRYSECLKWLNEQGIINPETGETYKWGDDIPEKDERYLVDTIGKPVMVTYFPFSLKSFYMSQPLLSNGNRPGVPGNSGIEGDSSIIYNDNKDDLAAGADPHDPSSEITESVDVLVPGVGEIVGGSMRIFHEDELLKAMEKKKVPPAAYTWYLDLRKYGGVRHGGCGLGLDRFACWVTGQDNIRKVTLFPRTMDRLNP